MRLEWRRQVQSGRDPELLALAVIVGGALLAGSWLLLRLPTPRCAFYALTGFPCATCGGTRCVHHLLTGQWREALAWNPLVFAGVLASGIFVAYAAAVTAFRLPRLRLTGLEKREQFAVRVALVGLLAANWIYLFHHFAALG